MTQNVWDIHMASCYKLDSLEHCTYLLVGGSHGSGFGEGGHVQIFVAEGGTVEHVSLVLAIRGLDDDETLP